MEKHIAVISSDISDFMLWLDEMNIQDRKFDSQMLVKSNNKTYHCIYKPTHTISRTFDSILETKNARKGGAYNSVLTHTRRCLKTQQK
jgi:hypothetical protein